jgi:hypothetical protein
MIWLRRKVLGRMACQATRCPHRRLGISIWCRQHTDEILEDRQSVEVVAGLDQLRAPMSEVQEEAVLRCTHACDEMHTYGPGCLLDIDGSDD